MMPPASMTSAASASDATETIVQDRLLHHANEIRKHGNLDPLDAFLTHSGYSWIEMMVSHARDSHDNYVSSTHKFDGTLAHAFEHRMAAELLKTPSPKKKRVLSNLAQMTADPFADDDKENAIALSPLKAKATELKTSVSVSQSKAPPKNTRSKADKNELVQLPNPFEKRALQANDNEKTEATTRKASSSKAKKIAPAFEKNMSAVKPLSPLRHDLDDDSREVECSLLAVSDVPRPHVRAKEVGKVNTLGLDLTAPINEAVEDATPSPRESTPPPMSPTKNERAEASMWARQKLDESLLRIESDDEEEEEEKENAGEEILLKEKDSETPKQLTHTVEAVAVKLAPESERLSTENSTANAISAPKRTLSSMAHAKKSLAGNNGNQQARSSSLAPSSSSVAKGSFLSKSIMRAELDQTTADDTLDTLASDTEKDALPAITTTAGQKRKSEESQSSRLTKSLKVEALPEETSKNSSDREDVINKEDKAKAAAQPQQTLKEKIESYVPQKPPTNAASSTPASGSASSGLSSMTAHQVGVGAAKIASPIFSRSASSNTLHAEPSSPSDAKKTHQSSSTSTNEMPARKMLESDSGDLGKTSVKAQTLPISTTPLNSPGPKAYSLYPKVIAGKKAVVPSVLTAKDKQQIKAAAEQKRTSHISIDDASESDLAAYDTSSDGDLSLVDLMVAAPSATSQPSAPRPPGATSRITPALPKVKAVEKIERPASSMANVKPATTTTTTSTYSTIKDVNRSPSRLGTASSTTSTSSGSSASSANHATWGGSISSKLKGFLGFSSSTSGQSPTRPTAAAKTANGVSRPGATQIPARKDSFVANGNTGARTAANLGASTTAKASSIIRQKEAEAKARQMEDRARLQAQSNAEAAKKRARDEALTTAINKSNAAKVTQQKPLAQQSTTTEASKKRKSNDGAAVVVSQQKNGATMLNATKNGIGAVGSSSTKIAGHNVKHGAQTVPKTFAKANEKPATVNSVFSDHNPFQRAQQQQQQQALAAVAQQMQRHNAIAAASQSKTNVNLSPNSKLKAAATDHIELEEPDSAYSDSEDEETIRRRMQHKPWETREGLAEALEAQSTIDADAIFGIPQGGVPLDDILPPHSENARVRRMRPRSSSATWSRDGLKQFEIDRYNERMGIKGPGVQLLNVPSSVRDDPARSPGRAGRMSALAQSAIAQGHVSSTLHKKTSQAFR